MAKLTNHHERMLAGLPYIPRRDGLGELYDACQDLIFAYNQLPPRATAKKDEIIRQIIGKCGSRICIETPFHCDYGCNIEVGENFYANYNLVILDVGTVIIGDNVMFAPNVSLFTATHPIHFETRNTGFESGHEIHIGNNVWLGGNVVVNPGITIGNNTVVGAGSVVTRDLPDNVLAVGNPARILRKITDADAKFYFKNCKIDF